MRQITDTKEIKTLAKQGVLKAVLRRKWNGIFYGKNILDVIDLADNQTEFYIKESVFYGAGWLTRKVKNYVFFVED